MTTQTDFEAATTAAVGSKVTLAGAGTIGLGWLVSNEFAVLSGVLLGIVGLAINWIYRARQDRREQMEHEARMRELERGHL